MKALVRTVRMNVSVDFVQSDTSVSPNFNYHYIKFNRAATRNIPSSREATLEFGETSSIPVPNAPQFAQFVQSDSTVNTKNKYHTEFNEEATTTIKNNLEDILDFGENSTTPVLSAPVNTLGMDVGSAEFVQSYTNTCPSNKFNGPATRTISTYEEDTLVFSDDGATPVLSEPANTDGMHFSGEFKQADTTVNPNNTPNGVAIMCIAKPFIIIVCLT